MGARADLWGGMGAVLEFSHAVTGPPEVRMAWRSWIASTV